MRDLGIYINKNVGAIGKQLADCLRELIKMQKLLPGEALPSMRLLAQDLEINRHTVRTIYEELISEGWLYSEYRKGYFVSEELPSSLLEVNKIQNHRKVQDFKFQIKRSVTMPAYAPEEKIKYNFQSGLPDLRLIPRDEIRSFIGDALRYSHRSIYDYGDTLGNIKLRNILKDYFRRMRGIANKEIVITNGSQEGLFIISQILLDQNDCVLMEEIGYHPAKATFENAGANVKFVCMDHNEISIDDLEKKILKYKPKAIFLTPLHQFPTTKILSMGKRYKIYELCINHNIFIIEDDYDHEFHFKPPIAPMAANDPYSNIIYLSTFSKCIYPSSRIGMMAIPHSLVNAVQSFKRICIHQNDGVIQEGIFKWMESGGLEKHLRRMRRIYHKRRDVVEDILNTSSKVSWEQPQGGMALWLNIGKDSFKFAKKAQKKGIYLLPESFYRFDNKVGTHLRLGYSNQNESELTQGIKEILELI